jgi:putative tricarboxylic transport membrane protein
MSVPMAPLILGFVLGEILETNLRRALSISAGDLDILWSSWIAIGLWVSAAGIMIVPRLLRQFIPPEARLSEE